MTNEVEPLVATRLKIYQLDHRARHVGEDMLHLVHTMMEQSRQVCGTCLFWSEDSPGPMGRCTANVTRDPVPSTWFCADHKPVP